MQRTRQLILAALLAAALGLAGCAGGGADSSDAGGSAAMPHPAAEEREAAADQSAVQSARGAATSLDRTTSETAPVRTPAVISTGTLTIRSDDVAAARFDLGKVVDALAGTVADEKTTAGDDGEVRLSRVVLRIPSEDFDTAMTDLAKIGEVTGSTRKAEDVTTEVIDTEVRIRAQEQSLERVEVLLTRAQSIRDVMAIEAQLTRRQAELDSLKSQLAWLEDQTSLSTITVYLERAPEGQPRSGEKDENPFVAGLAGGWDAMTAVGASLAQLTGALLPFAVLGLLLGVPGWVLLRRWQSRQALRRTTAAEA